VSIRRRGRMSIAAGVLVGGLATYVVFNSAGGIADTVDAIKQMDLLWLFLAIAAELLSYLLLGTQLRRLTGGAISVPRSTGISLIWFGLGNILPGAPAPGLALAAAELPHAGIEASQARMVLGLSAWFNGRTFLLIAALGCGATVVFAHNVSGDPLMLALLAIGLILLLAVTAWLTSREASARGVARLLVRFVPHRLQRQRVTPELATAWHARLKATVGPPRARARLVALGIAAWLADIACLGLVLRGAGVHVPVDAVLIAYVAGMAVSLLPLLPGGLGVVEATVPAVLHRFGAPIDVALAGTLIYRGIAFFLPAVVGGLALAAMRFGRTRDEPP